MVVSTMTLAEQGQLEEPLSLGLPELFTQHMFVPLLGPEEAKVFIAARNIHRFVLTCFLLCSTMEPETLKTSLGMKMYFLKN